MLLFAEAFHSSVVAGGHSTHTSEKYHADTSLTEQRALCSRADKCLGPTHWAKGEAKQINYAEK